MQATRPIILLFTLLHFSSAAKSDPNKENALSFASLSSLTISEFEVEEMMSSTFRNVLNRQPQLQGSLADQLAEMATFEVSPEEFEDLSDESLEDQVLELVQNYIDSDDSDKEQVLHQKFGNIFKRLSVLAVLSDSRENGSLREISSKLKVTIVSLSRIVIEEISFFNEGITAQLRLKSQEIQELYRLLKEQMMDSLEYIQIFDKVMDNLRLIYELNLKKIVEAVFVGSVKHTDLGFNAILYADRFAAIFKAMRNLQLTNYPKFDQYPVYMCLKLLFKKYHKSLESHSLTRPQITFTKKVLKEIFTYLLATEESHDLIQGIIATYLQMQDKHNIRNNNICKFFALKFEESGLQISQYLSEKKHENKLLIQHYILDALYQLNVCELKLLKREDFEAITENLEVLLDIPAYYFVNKRIYPMILFEETADAVKDYSFFLLMYSFVTRMKIREELSTERIANTDFNSFIDVLFEEKIDQSEPFAFDIDKNYVLLKFAAAFQQKPDDSMIEIPEMDLKMFDPFIAFLNSTSFTTFREFVETLYTNIFNADLPPDHNYEFVRSFNDFVFDNQIIQLTVKRQSSNSPRFGH